MARKKILFITRSAPYGQSSAQESQDAILAAGVFEQDVSVLFMDDGVFQLHQGQDGSAIGQKNLAARLQAYPLYDIEQAYVCEASLTKRHLTCDQLALPVTALDTPAIRQLIAEQDCILSS